MGLLSCMGCGKVPQETQKRPEQLAESEEQPHGELSIKDKEHVETSKPEQESEAIEEEESKSQEEVVDEDDKDEAKQESDEQKEEPEETIATKDEGVTSSPEEDNEQQDQQQKKYEDEKEENKKADQVEEESPETEDNMEEEEEELPSLSLKDRKDMLSTEHDSFLKVRAENDKRVRLDELNESVKKRSKNTAMSIKHYEDQIWIKKNVVYEKYF